MKSCLAPLIAIGGYHPFAINGIPIWIHQDEINNPNWHQEILDYADVYQNDFFIENVEEIFVFKSHHFFKYKDDPYYYVIIGNEELKFKQKTSIENSINKFHGYKS